MVGYQKILQLSYVDKFLSDIQKEFRERYKVHLLHGKFLSGFTDFEDIFKWVLINKKVEHLLESGQTSHQLDL